MDSPANDALRAAITNLKAENDRLRIALDKSESEARRYAAGYPQSSDGRNTFILLADRIAKIISGGFVQHEPCSFIADAIIADLPDMIAPQWQPIETAPKDGTHFLAYEEDGSMYRAAFGQYETLQSFCGQFVTEPPEPTHWMPLPTPPEATP